MNKLAPIIVRLLTTKMTVLETANLMDYLYEQMKKGRAVRGEGRLDVEMADLMKEFAPDTKGFSAKQISNYLRLANASNAEKQLVVRAPNLNTAFITLGWKAKAASVRRNDTVPVAVVHEIIEHYQKRELQAHG